MESSSTCAIKLIIAGSAIELARERRVSDRKFVVTYDALVADIVDTGADRPASLVILAEGRKRVIIRMEHRAIARLRKRIELMLQRHRASASPPAQSS